MRDNEFVRQTQDAREANNTLRKMPSPYELAFFRDEEFWKKCSPEQVRETAQLLLHIQRLISHTDVSKYQLRKGVELERNLRYAEQRLAGADTKDLLTWQKQLVSFLSMVQIKQPATVESLDTQKAVKASFSATQAYASQALKQLKILTQESQSKLDAVLEQYGSISAEMVDLLVPELTEDLKQIASSENVLEREDLVAYLDYLQESFRARYAEVQKMQSEHNLPEASGLLSKREISLATIHSFTRSYEHYINQGTVPPFVTVKPNEEGDFIDNPLFYALLIAQPTLYTWPQKDVEYTMIQILKKLLFHAHPDRVHSTKLSKPLASKILKNTLLALGSLKKVQETDRQRKDDLYSSTLWRFFDQAERARAEANGSFALGGGEGSADKLRNGLQSKLYTAVSKGAMELKKLRRLQEATRRAEDKYQKNEQYLRLREGGVPLKEIASAETISIEYEAWDKYTHINRREGMEELIQLFEERLLEQLADTKNAQLMTLLKTSISQAKDALYAGIERTQQSLNMVPSGYIRLMNSMLTQYDYVYRLEDKAAFYSQLFIDLHTELFTSSGLDAQDVRDSLQQKLASFKALQENKYVTDWLTKYVTRITRGNITAILKKHFFSFKNEVAPNGDEAIEWFNENIVTSCVRAFSRQHLLQAMWDQGRKNTKIVQTALDNGTEPIRKINKPVTEESGPLMTFNKGCIVDAAARFFETFLQNQVSEIDVRIPGDILTHAFEMKLNKRVHAATGVRYNSDAFTCTAQVMRQVILKTFDELESTFLRPEEWLKLKTVSRDDMGEYVLKLNMTEMNAIFKQPEGIELPVLTLEDARLPLEKCNAIAQEFLQKEIRNGGKIIRSKTDMTQEAIEGFEEYMTLAWETTKRNEYMEMFVKNLTQRTKLHLDFKTRKTIDESASLIQGYIKKMVPMTPIAIDKLSERMRVVGGPFLFYGQYVQPALRERFDPAIPVDQTILRTTEALLSLCEDKEVVVFKRKHKHIVPENEKNNGFVPLGSIEMERLPELMRFLKSHLSIRESRKAFVKLQGTGMFQLDRGPHPIDELLSLLQNNVIPGDLIVLYDQERSLLKFGGYVVSLERKRSQYHQDVYKNPF